MTRDTEATLVGSAHQGKEPAATWPRHSLPGSAGLVGADQGCLRATPNLKSSTMWPAGPWGQLERTGRWGSSGDSPGRAGRGACEPRAALPVKRGPRLGPADALLPRLLCTDTHGHKDHAHDGSGRRGRGPSGRNGEGLQVGRWQQSGATSGWTVDGWQVGGI